MGGWRGGGGGWGVYLLSPHTPPPPPSRCPGRIIQLRRLPNGDTGGIGHKHESNSFPPPPRASTLYPPPHFPPPHFPPLLSYIYYSTLNTVLTPNPISSIHPHIFFSRRPPQTRTHPDQGVTKRCRLSWLTNNALLFEPKCGGRDGDCGVSANEYSCVHHITWSPNNSIFLT